jgi:nicotinic acid mononucleotide adenylyltransferase
MIREQGVAWNTRVIRMIQGAIQRCASDSQPVIQIFHTAAGPCRPPQFGPWAVFPASFNPPTEAHAAILERAMDEANLHSALLLLDIHHADKPRRDAVMLDRALMMMVRFSGDPRLELGICSHGRFLEKTEAIRRFLGADTPWLFLVGADTLERIQDPRFYNDPERELSRLFAQARFLVFTRGEMPAAVRANMAIWRDRGARIETLDLPLWAQPLSSSMIRDRRSLGQPLGHGVDSAIARFIEETGLYLAATSPDSPYENRKRWLQRVS